MGQTTKVSVGEKLPKSDTGPNINQTVSVQTDSQLWLEVNQPKTVNLEFHTKGTSAEKRVSEPYSKVSTFGTNI
ncbi:hypothetical protein PHET_01114 [Paragonimus heterotremus]|uniref:Uncharacterized protein n=1 Tax=Paragonimus heterotremus TaxID=100268 RepID=A0A8J4WJI1_9TREM|nr:hypothetical protein PHET_01114 [Paragonimus heterotremus]